MFFGMLAIDPPAVSSRRSGQLRRASKRIILCMTANDLLQMTLALMCDADLPTDEKLAVLHAGATVIRDGAEAEKEALAVASLSSRHR